jgi:hypothetical protein
VAPLPFITDGGPLLDSPAIKSIIATAPPAKERAAAAPAPSQASACTGMKATSTTILQITAGAAEVTVNKAGKTKAHGAPRGVLLEILPPGPPPTPDTVAEGACRIKLKGGVKAGATRQYSVAADALTACLGALKLADCSKPMQARAAAAGGRGFKQSAVSDPVPFTPICAPCP